MASPADPGSGEAALLSQWLRPLVRDAAARGLWDDAALLTAPGRLVISSDTLVEGVHFLPTDPLGGVARKALRVNLSDLAAKAAEPLGYLLNLQWPSNRPTAEWAQLAAGLAADDGLFRLGLLGGDTVSTPGPLSLSVTVLGVPVGPLVPDRRAGMAGDCLLVSGTIGDAALGLRVATGQLKLEAGAAAALLDRYRLPQPRLALAPLLGTQVRAGMDVSDGVLADAAKLAEASGLSVVIDLDQLPLSVSGAAWVALGERTERLLALATGGDDYELLCAVAPADVAALQTAAAALGLPMTVIGTLQPGTGLICQTASGPVATPTRLGYSHAWDG